MRGRVGLTRQWLGAPIQLGELTLSRLPKELLASLANVSRVLVSVVMVFVSLGYGAVYAETRPFTILSTQSPPFKYLDEHNQPAGVHIDIWRLIFAELEIEYRFEFDNASSERVKTQIEKGFAEMHFSLSRKPERMAYYIFPEESYLSHTYSFFIRVEDKDKIRYNNLNDLKGWRVGATQSYSYTRQFWNAGLALDVMVNDNLHLPKLFANRIDVALLKRLNTLYQLSLAGERDRVYVLPKPLTSAQYYNAFSRASTQPDKMLVIDRYDQTIRRMKRDGTIAKIFEKYFGPGITE